MLKFDDTLMLCVGKNIDTNIVPMLIGEPGIGKSSWINALAEKKRTKVFVLQCNLLADKADLTGARLVPTGVDGEYKQVFYPHEDIMDAISYAEKHPRETPILFLDEINRTTADVTSACLGLSTARRIGSKVLPKNLRIIVAGNDKGNIISLDKASISRFVLYHVAPDTQTYISIQKDLNPFIKNVLKAHPDCLYGERLVLSEDDDGNEEVFDIIDESEDMDQITTPRTVSALSAFLNSVDNKTIIQLLAETTSRDGEDIPLLQEIIEGHVGNTAFTAFLLDEIRKNIQNTNTQANSISVVKPASYDDMKKCTDRAALDDFFANLDENEKSGIMTYAIYENADNRVYIETLASHLNSLISTDLSTVMNLSMTGQLDKENAQTLLETKSPLSTSLETILSLLG
jgi:hypothetical protein